MHWLRTAFSLLAAVFLLLAAVLGYLLTADLGRFKSEFESLLSEQLQREVSIAGAFHLTLGRSFHIEASQLRLAANDSSKTPQLASIDRLSASINPWSLLHRPIIIDSLTADGLRVNLERDENGVGNWELPGSDAPELEARAAQGLGLPLLPDQARINDAVLTYTSAAARAPFRLVGDRIEVALGDDKTVRLGFDGNINDTPFALALETDDLDALISLGPIDIEFSGDLGEINFSGEATIADLLKPSRPRLKLQLEGPSAEYLTDIFLLEQVTSGSLRINASAAPDDGRMQFSLGGEFGEFALSADGHFDDLQRLEEFEIEFSVSGGDAARLSRLMGVNTMPADPYSTRGTVTRKGPVFTVDKLEMTIGETSLHLGAHMADFPGLDNTRARLRVSGPDFGRFNRLLGMPGKLDGPFKLDADVASLAGGGAGVDLSATARGLSVQGSANIADTPRFVGSRVKLQLEGHDFQILAAALGLEQAPRDVLNVTLVAERQDEGARLESGLLTLGANSLSMTGVLGERPLESGTRLNFDLSGPNLPALLTGFGAQASDFPVTRYRLTGGVTPGPGYFTLHQWVAAIGDGLEHQLKASGIIKNRARLAGSTLTLSSRGENLGSLAALVGVDVIPEAPFDLVARVELSPTGYLIQSGTARVSDDSVNIEGLVGYRSLADETNLRFSAHSPDWKHSLAEYGIDIGLFPPGDLHLSGSIEHRDEYLYLPGTELQFPGVSVNVSGRLGKLPSLEDADLNLRVTGDDFAAVLPPNELFRALDKAFEYHSRITVDGGTVGVSGLHLQVDKSSVSGDAEFDLSSPLSRGKFKVMAESPDLFVLVPRLENVAVADKAPLTLSATVNWDENVWRLENFAVELAESAASGGGVLGLPPNFDHTDLKIDWRFSSLRNFSVLARRELPEDSGHLKFHLVGEGSELRLDELSAVVGDSDFAGEFTYRHGAVPVLSARFLSNHLDLRPYLPTLPEPKESPAHVVETAVDKNPRLIPDIPIPMNALGKFDADIVLRARDVVVHGGRLADVEARGSLAEGALVADIIRFTTPRGGELEARGSLTPVAGGGRMALWIHGTDMGLGLQAETEDEHAQLPTYVLDLSLTGSGGTVPEMAGSLDGYARVISGRGKVKALAMRAFTHAFLYQLIHKINPFAQDDPYTHLNCATLLASVENGVVRGSPLLVIQSDQLNIFADTRLNLETEELEVHFNTVPQEGLGLSLIDLINPYIKVHGSLADPRLTLDPESALVQLEAAAVTDGLSILALEFYDRFLTSRDPCADAVDHANDKFRQLERKYLHAEKNLAPAGP